MTTNMYTVFERFCNRFQEPDPNHLIALSLEIPNNNKAIESAKQKVRGVVREHSATVMEVCMFAASIAQRAPSSGPDRRG